MTTRPYRTDEELVQAAVYNALTLITTHDDGLVPKGYRQGFSVQIDVSDLRGYRARVWDAQPWLPGRPKTGTPREYRIDMTVTPVDSGPSSTPAETP